MNMDLPVRLEHLPYRFVYVQSQLDVSDFAYIAAEYFGVCFCVFSVGVVGIDFSLRLALLLHLIQEKNHNCLQVQ